MGRKFNAVKPDFYYDHYETHLAVDPNEVTAVLELGIHQGGSLLMWMEFFPRARIFGVDLGAVAVGEDVPRIKVLQADQADTASIGRFLRSNDVETLDLIIDDCSHIGLFTKQSYSFLFTQYLKPGGYYIIEDWGTGFSQTWPDGKAVVEPDTSTEPNGVFASHNRGIPGFAKQLVDQTKSYESIVFTSAFVAVKKQTPENAAALERAIELWDRRSGG